MPTAIITGASKGLGLALAGRLANAGWHLIIDARGAEALHAAADKLRVDGSAACRAEPVGSGERVRIEPIVGDITSAGHRDALIRAATAAGRLDLLVNNAGTLGPSPLPSGADLDPAALRDIVETNVVAPHELTRAALPLLRASHGVVVDITSDAAVEAYPGWGGYGAAKAATEQLRNVLAAEESDVTVWRVDPGDLRTDMHQLAFPGEDISDRPLPETVAPGLLGLIEARPPSGRYKLADFVPAVADEPSAIAVVALVGDHGAEPRSESGTEPTGAPVALWLTIEVDDFDAAATFYRDVVGLPEIDGWQSDDEVGSVFAVGPAARVEIERPATPSPGARLAIEYADLASLTTAYDRIVARVGSAATPLRRHDRGHSGFTIYDPRGTELYLWSEK
ncbi:MAG TPA: SDR family NAD(P)-dependent oxidoreductase [Micromonosporaceae bacterium]|nr:SDR family NAD(P)-dependent oxidoreductase [Micromonosporaceae bacterium]